MRNVIAQLLRSDKRCAFIVGGMLGCLWLWAEWQLFRTPFRVIEVPVQRSKGERPILGVVPIFRGFQRLAIVVNADRNESYNARTLRNLADLGYAACVLNCESNRASADVGETMRYFIGRYGTTNTVLLIGVSCGGEVVQKFAETNDAFTAHLFRLSVRDNDSSTGGQSLNVRQSFYTVLADNNGAMGGSRNNSTSASEAQTKAVGRTVCHLYVDSDAIGDELPLVVRLAAECAAKDSLHGSTRNSVAHVSPSRNSGKMAIAVALIVIALWRGFSLGASGLAIARERVVRVQSAALIFCGICIAVYAVLMWQPPSQTFVSLSRRFLVPSTWSREFDDIVSAWGPKTRLEDVFSYAELSHYTRSKLVNWKMDDIIYRDCVLSPVKEGDSIEDLRWRKVLWRYFYPLIKDTENPSEAAMIIARHLRERVSILKGRKWEQELSNVWIQGEADEASFMRVYVAALRSVAVPSRLMNGSVQVLDKGVWRPQSRFQPFDCCVDEGTIPP